MIRTVRSPAMKPMAAGAETAGQARFLQGRGSPEMQGDRFCKPVPVQDTRRSASLAAAVSSEP